MLRGLSGSFLRAAPSRVSHDICMDRVVEETSSGFDVRIPVEDGWKFLVEFGTRYIDNKLVNLVTIGVDGSNLGVWEAQNSLGFTDAKIHLYLQSSATGIYVQPCVRDPGEAKNRWGTMNALYLFPASTFNNEESRGWMTISESGFSICGRRLLASELSDREGTDVFQTAMSVILEDIARTGTVHIANLNTPDHQATTVYKVFE